MSTTTHPNSRKVWIRRTDSFLDAVQTQAKEFMSLSRKSIGSFFVSPTSRSIGSGLDFNEQRLLLPEIVNCEADDKDFRKEVIKYYTDIRTVVPVGDGIELEIGLVLDNNKPIGWKDPETGFLNFPIKISDYLRYRHAIAHPLCARTYGESQGNQQILFFVYDPEIEEKVVAAVDQQRDQAMETYLSIKDKADKVSGMLLLMGVDPRDYSGPNASVLMANKLRSLAEARSVEFNKIYTIDNFELRSKIEGFIKTGIFRRVADRIIEANTNVIIANNMREAIDILGGNNPEYKEKMAIWMGSYQEAIVKPNMAKRGQKKVTS
jgi:hypothetical protein